MSAEAEHIRILIVASKGKLNYSVEFGEALRSLGVESLCVSDRDYCFLSELKILKHVPFPKLLKLVKEFDPDFTLTSGLYYTPQMAKLVNKPLLVSLHGDLWVEAYWNRWNKGLYRSVFKRMLFEWKSHVEAQGIKQADLILPVSKWLDKQVRELLPDSPTHVLHVGVKPETWSLKDNTTLFRLKAPSIVSVFNFKIYPKAVGLANFVKVVRSMPDISFYFAGNGYYLNLIRRNKPPNMYLLGRLSKLDVRKLLASGDVFVHPSGWDSFGMSVVEAALMEKPIIASNIGGIPELIKDNETGYLCDINKTKQWTERIRFLLDNSNIAEKLGKNARRFVKEELNWEKIAKDFIRMLTKKNLDEVRKLD